MLEGYDEFLALTDKYADDSFLEAQKEKNLKQDECWYGNLDREDMFLMKQILEGEDISKHIPFID